MSSSYQPFPIMEFKTGTNTYLQPWIRPADAFDPLVNAYVYRGSVIKRAGYSQYGDDLGDGNPVMGIMQHQNGNTGAITLVVATTESLYKYVPGSDDYTELTLPASFTGTISNFFNYTNWQVQVTSTSYMYMVNGEDPITRYDGGTTVDQPTLAIDALTPTPTTIVSALDVKVYKNRLLAIRPELSTGGVQGQAIYWSATNNPTNFLQTTTGNGGNLSAPTGDVIQSAEFLRDIVVVFFTNSTWTFRYTGNDFAPFRWDKVNNSKSTNCPYGSIEYDERVTSIGKTGLIAYDGVNVQRYDLPIIDFYETNVEAKYYGQAFSQRYDNLNQSWTLYISKDNNFPVIDAVAPGSDQALVYNFLENTWCTYSFATPLTCLGIYYSQSDKTWEELTIQWKEADFAWNSYYTQSNLPILLAGDTTGRVWQMDDGATVADEQVDISQEIIDVGDGGTAYSGTTAYSSILPGTFTATDGTESFTSDSSGVLTGTLGGSGGIVYETGAFTLNFASAVTLATNITANYSSGTSIVPDIVSTRWNPIVTQGQKLQFGYIDIYYLIASFDEDNPISVTLNFYIDNSLTAAASRTLTLDGPTDSEYTFKRIYINLIGQFIQMEIDPNVNSLMQFNGFVLWVRPAGRLTGP